MLANRTFFPIAIVCVCFQHLFYVRRPFVCVMLSWLQPPKRTISAVLIAYIQFICFDVQFHINETHKTLKCEKKQPFQTIDRFEIYNFKNECIRILFYFFFRFRFILILFDAHGNWLTNIIICEPQPFISNKIAEETIQLNKIPESAVARICFYFQLTYR